jgi:ankyrin repeat protein
MEIVKLLIDAGADPNTEYQSFDNDCLVTPLHLAIKMGNIDIIKMLIAHGANINHHLRRPIADITFHWSAVQQCALHPGPFTRITSSTISDSRTLHANLSISNVLHSRFRPR